jgi:ribonuclease J
MADLAFDAAVNAFDQMARARRRDPDTVTETVRRAVRGAVGAAWGKKPICHVHILAV